MAYKMFLNGLLMPVCPGKVTVKVNGQNKTMNLLNGEEINLLKTPGLSDVSFELLLPHRAYPFSSSVVLPPSYYLAYFQRLSQRDTGFQWILVRTKPGGGMLHYTNMTVALENYQIIDDALFAGGANGTRSTDIVDSVDAYSASLTRTAAATLSGKRKWIGAASLEGRAFFAGGASTNLNSNTKCANVEVYNGTLTRTAATNLSVARYSPLTATIGGRVLFAGGDFTKVVDVYSASLTRTAAADLSRSTSGGDASIAVGNYAIFTSGLVVGSDGVGSFVGNTSCDVYNASLTKTTVTLLSVARVYMSAGTVGDYALFAGGGSNSPYSDVVDACDTSLTRTTVTALDYPRRNLSSATVGDYLLFAGGGRDYDDPSSVVFVYTA